MVAAVFIRLIDRLPESISKKLNGRGSVVLIGAGARVFALISQLVVLLIMSWMLPKSELGDALIVFSLYRLIGLGLGTGSGSIILYHVSRSDGRATVDVPLLRTMTVLSATLSGLLTILLVLSAPEIAAAFNKPGLQPWLVGMAPMVLFGTLNLTSAGSLDGQSRVTESIILTEAVPNALRLIGFPLIILLGLADVAISHVLWISLALPWLWDMRRVLNGAIRGFAPLRWWDIKYAGWSAINPIVGQQLQGIDMLVVGALFSSSVAAEYSIASRLATLFPFLQQIAIRSFMPAAGALIAENNSNKLNEELQRLKSWSLILVLGMTICIMLPSPFYLKLFGDYESSLKVMIALSLAPILRSLFAGIDVALKMTGRAGYSALVSIIAAVTVVGAATLLAPAIGIYALPIAMFISAVTINPVVAHLTSRTGIRIVNSQDIALVTLGLVGTSSTLWIANPNVAAAAASIWLSLTLLVALKWKRAN